MPGLLEAIYRGILSEQPQPQPRSILGLASALHSQAPSLGTGITMGGTGLAPYGLRHSGEAPKGLGFFGMVPNPQGGYSTELSSEFDRGGKAIEHPLMVPTLTAQELNHLLSGADPTDAIYEKARAYALQRISQGQSPFAGPGELRYPIPK